MTQVIEQVCLVDGLHGIHVPREFVLSNNMEDWGIAKNDLFIILDGPENEHYWETWDKILNEAKILIDGETWKLAQDGDLFAVRMR